MSSGKKEHHNYIQIMVLAAKNSFLERYLCLVSRKVLLPVLESVLLSFERRKDNCIGYKTQNKRLNVCLKNVGTGTKEPVM